MDDHHFLCSLWLLTEPPNCSGSRNLTRKGIHHVVICRVELFEKKPLLAIPSCSFKRGYQERNYSGTAGKIACSRCQSAFRRKIAGGVNRKIATGCKCTMGYMRSGIFDHGNIAVMTWPWPFRCGDDMLASKHRLSSFSAPHLMCLNQGQDAEIERRIFYKALVFPESNRGCEGFFWLLSLYVSA